MSIWKGDKVIVAAIGFCVRTRAVWVDAIGASHCDALMDRAVQTCRIRGSSISLSIPSNFSNASNGCAPGRACSRHDVGPVEGRVPKRAELAGF